MKVLAKRGILVPWVSRGAAAALLLGFLETLLVLWVTPTAHGDPALAVGLLLAICGALLPVGVVLAVLAALVDGRLPWRGLPDGAKAFAVAAGALVGVIPLRLLHRVAAGLQIEFMGPVDWLLDVASLGIMAVAIIVSLGIVAPLAKRWQRGREEAVGRLVFGGLCLVVGGLGLHVLHRGLAVVHEAGPSTPLLISSMALVLLGIRILAPLPARGTCWAVLGLSMALALTGFWAFQDPGVRYVFFSRAVGAQVPADTLGRLSDLDGDGVAPRLLGGADCAPLDGSIHPLARDLPGDGIDQDCRGGDAVTLDDPIAEAADPWERCAADLAGRRLNLLVISVDAVRGEVIEAGLTPNIMPFLARSAWFLRAYSPSTHTDASMPSIMAGLMPSDLGGVDWIARGGRLRPLPGLATELQSQGYQTSFFGLMGEREDDTDGYFLWQGFERFGFPSLDPPGVDGPKAQYAAGVLTETALRFLGQEAREPFFLWVHHLDPHAPYVPISREAMPLPDGSDYERGVAYTMIHVGRLLEALEASPLADHTVVVLTSDHGEDLGERGREGHGPDLFEESIHVPLALHLPGCPGVVVDDPVSLVELAPTLAKLMGVSVDEWTLLDAVAGRERPVPVVAEVFMAGAIRRAVVDRRYKLLVDVRHGGALLFDLQEDPDELTDLHGRDEEATKRLEALYTRWLDRPHHL